MHAIASSHRFFGATSGSSAYSHAAAWLKAVRCRLMLRNDRRRLAEMPDYLLADIGISRGEIESATEFAAIRRLGPSYRI